jgi:hypothetical protein
LPRGPVAGDPRVVDQHVQAPVFGVDAGGRVLDRRRVGDVEGDRLPADRGRGAFSPFWIPRADQDGHGVLGRELSGDREADSLVRPGHQGNRRCHVF